MATVLSLDEVCTGYGRHRVVESVSLTVQEGEFISLIGPNGAGKTTLLSAVSGDLPVSSGRIWFAGREVTHWRADRRARAGIGRTWQKTNLFPHLAAIDNVRLAVEARRQGGIRKLFSTRSADTLSTAWQQLEVVGLSDQAHKSTRLLSHGDKRKLEVAMILAVQPQLLLLDEPTAGMAAAEVPIMLNLIEALKAQQRFSILLVEHKIDVVMRLSDRIIVLQQGALLADGSPAEVMANEEVQAAYLGGKRHATD